MTALRLQASLWRRRETLARGAARRAAVGRPESNTPPSSPAPRQGTPTAGEFLLSLVVGSAHLRPAGSTNTRAPGGRARCSTKALPPGSQSWRHAGKLGLGDHGRVLVRDEGDGRLRVAVSLLGRHAQRVEGLLHGFASNNRQRARLASRQTNVFASQGDEQTDRP